MNDDNECSGCGNCGGQCHENNAEVPLWDFDEMVRIYLSAVVSMLGPDEARQRLETIIKETQ